LVAGSAFCALAGVLSVSPARATCTVAWNQLVATQAEHEDCVREFGSDVSHFTRTWRTAGSWDGAEGYMRWRVTRTMGEDDDGYYINHPTTALRSIYLSFVTRVGSSWWRSHTQGDRFKFVMFYPSSGTNPRPTVFDMPIHSPDGTYRYRTFGPDLAAGGQGCDQFGNCNHNQGNGYPHHTYQEGASGSNQWYFVVMSLESDRTKVYIWSQDGRLSGQYAQSQIADASTLRNWNAQSWSTVRLLAYIESTTAGDENAYMDIGRIRVTQSLPSPPQGFVTGRVASVPNPPSNIVIE
jgi:hypothetical protein